MGNDESRADTKQKTRALEYVRANWHRVAVAGGAREGEGVELGTALRVLFESHAADAGFEEMRAAVRALAPGRGPGRVSMKGLGKVLLRLMRREATHQRAAELLAIVMDDPTPNVPAAPTAVPADPVEIRRVVLRVAADLGCDVRSVRKVVDGGSVRGHLDARIRQSMQKLIA